MKIDRDSFEEWQAHPLTELLFKALEQWAQEAKAHWVTASWDGGQADPVYLERMRERAKALMQVRNVTAEQIEETLE